MPGFSPECMSGQHRACLEPEGSCRCECHPTTQALMKKGPGKPDPRGGIRRKLKKNISEAVAALPPEFAEEVPLEVHNTCPLCGSHARATDTFCRKDGTKLALGKQCLGCGAPSEPEDAFCWQCGLKAGEKPPEPAVDATQEDLLVRLRKEAIAQGLLKETVVS